MNKSLVWFDWLVTAFIGLVMVFCYTLAVFSLVDYFRYGEHSYLVDGLISLSMTALNAALFFYRFWCMVRYHTLTSLKQSIKEDRE